MAIPNWPNDVPYKSLKDGFSIDPFLSPIKTEMNQGNVRLRSRPGDNTSIVQQSVLMTTSEFDVFVVWGKGTIGNWTGRFTAQVWLGSAYASKTCQFSNGAPKPVEFAPEQVAVQMALRVYGV